MYSSTALSNCSARQRCLADQIQRQSGCKEDGKIHRTRWRRRRATGAPLRAVPFSPPGPRLPPSSEGTQSPFRALRAPYRGPGTPTRGRPRGLLPVRLHRHRPRRLRPLLIPRRPPHPAHRRLRRHHQNESWVCCPWWWLRERLHLHRRMGRRCLSLWTVLRALLPALARALRLRGRRTGRWRCRGGLCRTGSAARRSPARGRRAGSS